MTRSSLFPDANDKNQQCLFELEILQATVEDEESGHAKQIGKLIGVDPDLLIDNFVQPKIKVVVGGNCVEDYDHNNNPLEGWDGKNKYRNKWKSKVGAEWVTKGQNVDQATNAVSAIGRCAEEKWIQKCFFHPGRSLKNSSAILWIVAMKLWSTSQRSGFLSLVGDHFLTKRTL